MVFLPATRAVDTVGLHPMFYGRVSGIGSQMPGGPSPYDRILDNIISNNTGKWGIDPRTPEMIAAEKAESDAWFAKKQQEVAENQKKLDEMKSWRSNTPIASWTMTSPSGDKRIVKVYGYNKEIGYVWLAEGPNSNAESSSLYPEYVLASKSPEWVAWKSGSGSGSGTALPLLLGAAYLLLS